LTAGEMWVDLAGVSVNEPCLQELTVKGEEGVGQRAVAQKSSVAEPARHVEMVRIDTARAALDAGRTVTDTAHLAGSVNKMSTNG
jgi:hypothetical protein